MAKAMNPRKAARDKRKNGAAAKRTSGKRATQARKFTAASSPPAGRVSARPSGGRALDRSRRSQSPQVKAEVKREAVPPSPPEPPRLPPPLPVPIASFTF